MYYFKYDLAGYQKGEENVSRSLQPVVELDRMLNEKGIDLKVFVSPYEAQFRRVPPEDHDLPQRMISTILTREGVENYDLAPDFARFGPKASELFLYGDTMHLSADGAKVVAETVCSKLSGCKISQ